MVTQYKNKLLSYTLYAICILLHKVGLIISLIAFTVYYIDNLGRLLDENDYIKKNWQFIKKEFLYVILFLIIFIFCFFLNMILSRRESKYFFQLIIRIII